ncbi:helix-hairpin-helix domain-containing protein [Streptomyces sp. NRRL F-5135]|uniref:helix-hairpin-helix domain-containing protein n=1 Tax=Streptomyces sp. NRRL F-5135 TaxID=1463858 RepID=UPI00099BB929
MEHAVSTDREAAREETGPAADTGRVAADPAPEPGTAAAPGTAGAAAAATSRAPSEAAPEEGPSEVGDGSGDADGSGDTDSAEEAASAGELSETEAELAAQRAVRERIEQRKAEKAGPIDAGGKLSGRAADLLAAVRAVESGERVEPGLLGPPPAARPPAAAPGGDGRPTEGRAPSRPQRPPGPAGPAAPTAPGVPPTPAASPRVPPEAVAAVREVLARGGAPDALAGRVAAVLGERAADALRADPWRLLAVAGVRPEQADGFARALLGAECGPGDARRAVALVGWLLERAALQGHTALEASAVRKALAGHAVPDPDEAVRHAVAEGAVLVFREGDEDGLEGGEEGGEFEEAPDGDAESTSETVAPGAGAADGAGAPEVPVLLGLDRYALAEESLADGLARLVRTGSEAPWPEAVEAAPPVAADLARAATGHGLVLHTGGEAARAEPVALAESVRAHGLRATVAVHSENGRDRLRTAGGPEPAEVVTVAGLLAGAEGPGRDADGMFALDLLVVLDAPQLDVETAAMLVESLPDGARLVLSGDPGVLWSAGAGRVFADLLAARVCPRVASRTPDPGPIGELVSGIGAGELNEVAAPGKEVVIVPVRDAGEAVHRTVQLVADSVPRAFGTEPARTRVIAVGHGGSAGTRALNAALKERLNPGPGRFGGFDPGDRVAYVPEPGRTLEGSVVSADAEGLRLDCGGAAVVVPRDRVESAVRHGWALTAHQAAGMRWPAAVVVLPGDAAKGLSRPWVYTAFGRGERHLSVVHGVDRALPRAVAEIPAQERTTRLLPLVRALLAPPDHTAERQG